MRLNTHGNTAKDYRCGRALRNNATPAEKKLWRVLREIAKVNGLKFRRQQPIHPFIADFACMEIRLLVELDGDTHANQVVYDKKRDRELRSKGFQILRYGNRDIAQNLNGVAQDIINKALILKSKRLSLLNSPLPGPPHEGEGEIIDISLIPHQNMREFMPRKKIL